MGTPPLGMALRCLFRRDAARHPRGSADQELLAQFAADRDEAAFAELVYRHGPMVLGACRRILRESHDAEDTFQATFLVLARKAAALDGRRPLAGWLYTVARNLALKHHSAAVRRRALEQQSGSMRGTAASDDTARWEFREVLDVELGRLPEKYRAPLVLCHLQGMTHEAAADALGWSAGSMAKRLTRGRELLRERLAHRGVALSAATLAVLTAARTSSAVSPTAIAQMSRAASCYAAGQATTGLVSNQATALACRAADAFGAFRWKLTAALLVGVGLLGAAAVVVGGRASPEVAQVAAAPELPTAKPTATEDDPRNQEVRRKLVSVISTTANDMPLKDFLESLAAQSRLDIRLDEDAFAAGGMKGVDERLVSLPPHRSARLEAVLRNLLRQIDAPDGRVCGYRIERGVLVVAPLLLENRPQKRLPRWLPESLFHPVRCDREPHGISLAEAIEVYGKVYGQKMVLDRQAFADLGERDADKYPLAGRGRALGDEPRLLDVLDVILWQVDGNDWNSYFYIRDGVIEITAARSDSDRAKMLSAHQELVRAYEALRKEIPQPKIQRNVTLDQGIDANTPLKDVLEFLGDRFDLSILVDEAGFEAAGIDKVGERPIQLAPHCEVPLENVWEDLASKSGTRARLAGETLARAPRETAPYLKRHVRPAIPPDRDAAARARKLLADLDSDEFAVRQKATDELEKLGHDAVPASAFIPRLLLSLRERLTEDPPLEVRCRVEQILERLASRDELVRSLRAVRVLDAIGTAEARQVLEMLANGERSASATQAAREALNRRVP